MPRTISDTIAETVTSWDGVTAQPHRFGGIEFRANHREIGHLHGNRQADLPFPIRIRTDLVARGLASPHHILPETGWVTYYIRSPEDVRGALYLFRTSYELITQKQNTSIAHESE